MSTMTPRKLVSFAIDPDLAAALKAAKDETGAAESEIIRRAIREWMEKRGYLKTERKRGATRKRP
jgi:hypothetical protein